MKRVHWLVLVLLLLAAAAAGVHLRLRAVAAEAALAPEVIPVGLLFNGGGEISLRERRTPDLWNWDIRQFSEIVRDALAGTDTQGTELQALPFELSRNLAGGAELVSADYDPPVRFAVDRFRKADALALHAPSPTGRVSLYLRTPAGKWYRYDTSLPVSRLIRYRETVVERHNAEGGD